MDGAGADVLRARDNAAHHQQQQKRRREEVDEDEEEEEASPAPSEESVGGGVVGGGGAVQRLMEFALCGDKHGVVALLKSDPDAVDAVEEGATTPLHIATRLGHTGVIEALLK
jgi:hypothetical protein